jgi:hypothetical protein
MFTGFGDSGENLLGYQEVHPDAANTWIQEGSAGYNTAIIIAVGDASAEPPPPPPPPAEISCDSGNWFYDAVCAAVGYLFYPSDEQQESLGDTYGFLTSSISSKPPLGYFDAITIALDNINGGTSTISLMSASNTAAFSGVFTPLKTGLTWILWFLFGFWIFHRIRLMTI